MAFTYFLHGFTVLLPISKPANSTFSLAKWNLSGLRVMPWRPHVSSHLNAWKKHSSIVRNHRRVSSIHFVLLGMDDTTSSYLLV